MQTNSILYFITYLFWNPYENLICFIKSSLFLENSILIITLKLIIQDVAFLLLKESWKLGVNPLASKGSPLHGPRIRVIEKARDLFRETREHTFESKAADEHQKLLR